MDVTDGGTISGEVKFAGNPPSAEKLEVTKDTEVCGRTEKLSEVLMVGANKGVQNVVVFLADVQKGKKLEASAKNPSFDQKGCQYIPHMLSFPVGSTLDILNSDGILHNIHTHSERNPSFNQAQPKFKKVINKKFDHPETIKVTCDVHGWMIGWFVVQDHPYYAVTDANGAFQLTDVPPGDYELRIWHETLGETTQKVSVKAKEDTNVSVELAKK
jgi:plastocyanin